jgi:myosin V
MIYHIEFFVNLKAPRTMKASMLRVSGRSSGQAQSNHWQKIIEGLDKLLKILQDNHVCFSFVLPI